MKKYINTKCIVLEQAQLGLSNRFFVNDHWVDPADPKMFMSDQK